MDHLIDEIIPFVESHFSTGKGAQTRALFGKSSGGYGSLVHGMLRPDAWGAIASLSGDAYFEYAYLPDFPNALETLDKFNGDVKNF